jgi:hypothetical protein
VADSCELCVRYRTGPKAGQLFMRCVACAARHLDRKKREQDAVVRRG